MSRPSLPCVELEPAGPARASVVWLHGLGADGHDFEPIVPHLGVDDLMIRFVFPHAPMRPVTINGGMTMRAWYDILALDLGRRIDEAGVLDSSTRVAELLRRETQRGIPSSRVILAGFSQGGAIALHLGLRHDENLAGIVALSTYLVREGSLAEEARDANTTTPIFQAHGVHDPVVPVELGRHAHETLLALGCKAAWREYPIGHEVSLPEIKEVGDFLRSVLAS